LGAVSYSPFTVTMVLSCISSEIKLDIGRKSDFFHIPLHSAPPLEGSRRNIAIPFGVEKLEWWCYTRQWKNFEDMCNCLHTIPACNRQTDRRTDRQTSCHGIVRAMHTRRAVIESRFSTSIGLYLGTDATIVTGRRIRKRTQDFEWYHFEWPCVTSNPDVTIYFNVK